MAYWFYYTTDGQKQGAVSEEQLKELAVNGKITPGTMLEHQSGDKTIANEVKWLAFGESIAPTPQSHPTSINASFQQIQTATASHGAEKTTQPFGEKMQNVGKGMQSAGKNITGGCCGCATLLFVLFVLIGIFSPAPINLPDYSITSDTELQHFKRSVVVRLTERATEDELTAIANKIKKQNTKSYERTFIEYYLPGMKPGEGAWATTHFNPDLKVRIYDVSDVKQNEEEYRESVESLEKISVELTAEPIIDSEGRISFAITTNLPDNVVLMLTLQEDGMPTQPGSTRQGKVTIKNGTATSEKFGSIEAPVKGKHTLSVTMSLPRLQDKTVTAIIGNNGEFLTGDLVEKSSLGNSNTVRAKFEMDF